mgnify:CR=1 FL=1
MESRIILPLDNVPWENAYEILDRTRGMVWGYKIRRSILDRGLPILAEIRKFGRVMLDFKLYDIPSAMTESLNQHIQAGADITTVHCSSCYEPASQGLTGERIAGVTVLTSMDDETFRRYYAGESIPAMVRHMAEDAESRYEYLVCSARELVGIRHLAIKKICPGIRPLWYQTQDDQHRTATPAEAISNGAHLLVIGRPLLGAENMVEAIRRTNDEIWEATENPVTDS